MVGVAQLVELRVVIPAVVGSSPIVHPIYLHIAVVRFARIRTRNARETGVSARGVRCRSHGFETKQMQISVETTSGLERRLTIMVPSETFEQQITDKLVEARGRIRLDGFRAGKVPLKEVRRRFGQSVRAEVAGELMQSSFLQAIEEESLSPAGAPNLEVIKMDPGIDFEFSATFEVYPAIALRDSSEVEVKKPVAEIDDADIDAMVERLREQRRTFVAVDRAAQDQDRLTVDFVGRLDGEVFEGGSGEGMQFTLGGGQMIDDFDAGVRGASTDETVTFDATFPDDYRAEDLQGKTVQFEVTIKAIEESRLPELDAEFFESFGVEEEDGEAGFRSEVRANMTREMDGAVRNQLKTQVLESLDALHEVSVPEAMVGQEIQRLKAQMQQQLQSYAPDGQMPGQLPEFEDDLFRDEAAKRVKTSLIVREIIVSRNLEPDPDLVRARIEELASSYAESEQVVNYYYGNEELLRQVESAVLEEQVVDSVLDGARLEIVNSNYNDIISGAAVAPPPDPAADTAEPEVDASAESEPDADPDSKDGDTDEGNSP